MEEVAYSDKNIEELIVDRIIVGVNSTSTEASAVTHAAGFRLLGCLANLGMHQDPAVLASLAGFSGLARFARLAADATGAAGGCGCGCGCVRRRRAAGLWANISLSTLG